MRQQIWIGFVHVTPEDPGDSWQEAFGDAVGGYAWSLAFAADAEGFQQTVREKAEGEGWQIESFDEPNPPDGTMCPWARR
jgi:hypothetical protein